MRKLEVGLKYLEEPGPLPRGSSGLPWSLASKCPLVLHFWTFVPGAVLHQEGP
jgi:hypothetical protein